MTKHVGRLELVTLLCAAVINPLFARAAAVDPSQTNSLERAGDEVRLARDGVASLPVIVGPAASERVRAVASTLAEYLGKISGGRFVVEQGDGSTGIVVGLPGDFSEPPFEITFPGGPLGREDYLLRSTERALWLIGATELAVEHATWDLLYRLGYRQFFPPETWQVIPESPDLSISVNDRESPDFHARRIWYNWGMGFGYNREPYRKWSARNRAVKGFDLNSGHAYEAFIASHRELFEEHPEYRGLVDGKRQGNKLCISNTDLRRHVVDWAVEKVKANPDVDSVSMEPSDGGGWCDCERCAAIGTPSDRALLLANEVATAINQLDLGDKYVGMYAYHLHGAPPSIKVHPKVIVSATTAFITGGLTLEKIIDGWQAQGATLGIYDYFSVIAWDWNLPRRAKTARPKSLAESIRHYHQKGARFFDAESGDAWGPYGLGFYVASRVMWDVDEADRVDQLVDDFLTKAFGPAREPMARFYHLITEDKTRRSNADLQGRMYRRLAEARKLAANSPRVQQRIDDLILYARYVELYNAFANATAEKQRHRDRLLTHAYRMRETSMVHVYALWARTVGQKAAHTKDHPLKSNEPFSHAEIEKILAGGIENHQPVDVDFETVEFSNELIPAADPLDLPDVQPGRYPSVPQDRQTYWIWVHEAPADVHLKVTVKKVWDLRPHKITLFSPKDVTVEPVDESGIVKPDGTTYDVILKTTYHGLHRIQTRDGGDHTRIAWPEGMPVTLPSAIDTPGVFKHFRGAWTLYFYVPRGADKVAGWAARIANWAPRISGTLKDADGNVQLDFSTVEDGWFVVPVPDGQDGKLWKFENTHGVRQLVTVPPYLAVDETKLLLPKEVVAADGQ